ncbi:MAG: hypothetical protein K6360_06135 [Deltaproteobacteria bacterium]
MKIDLEPVLAIQEVDLAIRDLVVEKEKAPERLKALAALLSEREAGLVALEERRRELQGKKTEIEDELELDQVRLGKSQTKLTSIKTNREYQALLKEIEEIKKTNKAREDEILAILEELDGIAAQMDEKRKVIEETRKEMDAEERRLKGLLAEIDEKIASLQRERDEKVVSVPKDILARYDFLRQKRGGLAIVEVRQSVCTGCNMNIPPQLYNELLRNEKIHFCPTCQRIIYAKLEALQEA